MECVMKTTIELSPEEVQAIIKKEIESRGLGDVSDVDLEIVSKTVGYGIGEYEETKFNRALVIVSGETKIED